jgi:TetR/AcrR family transcriptional repressor of nem operon
MDSRQRIIESTRELLWDRGYTGTSPKAIQDRAGVGQGSMYHHFAGKAALAVVALEATAQALTADIEDTLGADLPPLERLCRHVLKPRDVLRGCRIGQMANDPEIARDPQLRAPITEAFASRRELIQQTFAAAQAAGELSGDADPAQLTVVMLAVVQGGYVLARAAGTEQPFHQAIRGFLDLLALHTPNGLPEFAR